MNAVPVSKAQIKAVNKYIWKVYDRINLTVPKGRKRDIEYHADRKNESVNGLINRLLREDMGIPGEEWKKEK